MVAAHIPDGVPNTIQENSVPCTPGIEGLVLEAMERDCRIALPQTVETVPIIHRWRSALLLDEYPT
eukprot:6791147-Prymnesium_polylepis.1